MVEKTTFKSLEGMKACPFCNSKDIVLKSEYYGNLFTVYCHNCFVRQSGYITEQQAIEKWNKRNAKLA